jgi:hypothetical protein
VQLSPFACLIGKPLPVDWRKDNFQKIILSHLLRRLIVDKSCSILTIIVQIEKNRKSKTSNRDQQTLFRSPFVSIGLCHILIALLNFSSFYFLVTPSPTLPLTSSLAPPFTSSTRFSAAILPSASSSSSSTKNGQAVWTCPLAWFADRSM